MKYNRPSIHPSLVALAILIQLGCGSETAEFELGAGGTGTASMASSNASASSAAGGVAGAGGNAASSVSSSDAATTTSGAGGSTTLPDPEKMGPLSIQEVDATATVAATGNQVPIHVAHPVMGGPYPTVVLGHGFQLPMTQYYSYIKQLASFGYVAIAVDFPASFVGNKHTTNAKDLLGALDWAAANLSGLADTSVAGASGHSLGGKAALLAASMDTRVQASMTLDPVDSAMNCSPSDCPDVSALLPLGIPTAFVGETIDSVGALQACAPAADNFMTFYANANAPSIAFDVLGANHMSFLDNPASCGLPCVFCNAAQVDGATVTKISRALMVAFYERHLKGKVGYDLYLTGATAQQRYVDTGFITIQSK